MIVGFLKDLLLIIGISISSIFIATAGFLLLSPEGVPLLYGVLKEYISHDVAKANEEAEPFVTRPCLMMLEGCIKKYPNFTPQVHN